LVVFNKFRATTESARIGEPFLNLLLSMLFLKLTKFVLPIQQKVVL